MPDKIKVIAIMGPAQSGKSEIRKFLIKEYGYAWLSLAEPLKDMLVQFVVSQGCDPAIAERMFYGDMKEEPSEYLDGRTPRHAMQTIGTEWRDIMSKTLYSNAWKRTVLREYGNTNKKIIVDDLRFKHEERMLRENFDTLIIRVKRKGKEAGDHPSEREFLEIEPDIIVNNVEGNIQVMLDQVALIGGSRL